MDQEEESLPFQPVFILLSVVVILTVFWYYGREPFFNKTLRGYLPPSRYSPIYSFLHFSFSSVLLRGVIPLLLIKLILRKNLRDFGYSFKGTSDLRYVYLFLVLLVLPLVIWAGSFASFQHKYPLCHQAIRDHTLPWQLFVVYQVAYFFFFVSIEAFWRGYMLFGLRPYMGYSAIFVMIIPYVMGHYGKPFPEAMGAIVTGGVLGFLALRHGNFWLGVLTHYLVALAMDITAIVYRGISLVSQA